MRKVYLDSAATTRVNAEVLNEMMPYFTTVFGNSSSLHTFGRDAVNGVDKARDIIAKNIGCKSTEIFFTCGVTESNNWSLRGVAYANIDKGKHIFSSLKLY